MINTFIDDSIKEQIREVATIEDVASDFSPLQKKGQDFLQDCPSCGSQKKLSINPKKKIFKCWVCGVTGTSAAAYLIKTQSHTYIDALRFLADRYSLQSNDPGQTNGKKAKKRKPGQSFKDAQLADSGIPPKFIQYKSKASDSVTIELDRYTSGSVDKHFEIINSGDDMLIHYVDLDFRPITFKDTKGKSKPFYRVRFQNPALQGGQGKPAKYKSPYKSGNHLWIPNAVINAVRTNTEIETLVICEGEKKADKLCCHNIMAVGIAGIHNFSSADAMPHQFQRIIQDCNVKNVVFLLDADWQELKAKPGQVADSRPWIFYRAVSKFRDYFRHYSGQGIFLDIFFGHHLDESSKGIDDLLTGKLKKKESELEEDFKKAVIDRDGSGEHIQLYKITDKGDYQLKQFWHIHARPAFNEHYKEELIKLKEFKLGRITWRVNTAGELEMAQKIMPDEQYWRTEEWIGRDNLPRKKTFFSYRGAKRFLRNRGFGKYQVTSDIFRFIHVENQIVREVSPPEIQDYMVQFTEDLNEPEVEEMLLSGNTKYFGPNVLSGMYKKEPNWLTPEKGVKYMVFKNCAWRITKEGITEMKHQDLPGHVWSNEVINFEPKVSKSPLFNISTDGENWKVEEGPQYQDSDLALFIERTSNFWWRKRFDVHTTAEGQQYVKPKEEPENPNHKELQETIRNIVAKILATGYVLNDYKDRSNMRAIIAMDGVESEVGSSQGGTGKSIWGTMFEHITSLFVIDAKAPGLTEDKFIYDGVDERTKMITFDDCRVNLDFEFFLSQITRGVTVNWKGRQKFTLNPPPNFIFLTNHAIKGSDNSTLRRQYLVSFSDYFNSWRTPKDDFGRLLFFEWDFDQWNHFYNYMASSVMAYFQHDLIKVINDMDLNRRKLRQFIGEDFLEWAELKFSPGGELNKRNEKGELFADCIVSMPLSARKYYSLRNFKKKIKAFCSYAGFEFNPHKEGQDFKSNSQEFFVVADDDFDPESLKEDFWKMPGE